jgi:hypothetical protein
MCPAHSVSPVGELSDAEEEIVISARALEFESRVELITSLR